eukprot:403360253
MQSKSEIQFLQSEPQTLIALNIDYQEIDFCHVQIFEKQKNTALYKPIWRNNSINWGEKQFNCQYAGKTQAQLKQWPVSILIYGYMALANEYLFRGKSLNFQFISQDDKKQIEIQLHKQCIIENPQLKKLYTFKKKLGKGGQAQVDLYTLNDDQEAEFAIKTFLIKQKDSVAEIYREIQFLRELDICNNVVQLHQVYREIDKIHLVMNYAKHGPLIEHLYNNKLLVENDIRIIMEQLLLALDLMHMKGILHRDLKPDNILILDNDNLQVCIADLGLSCRLTEIDMLQRKCGTPGYVAPEILQGKATTYKSDIFSLGCLFYNLLTGQVLFWGSNKKEILKCNQNANPWKIIDSDELTISNECMELLKWMLHRDPDQRPSTEDCLNTYILLAKYQNLIQHKWFQPDINSFWQSKSNLNQNDGEMSCGGGMTRKRGASNNVIKDSFKICYSQALQNARLSNSPVNTIKNQWSSLGRENNLNFGSAAAQKQNQQMPQQVIIVNMKQGIQGSSTHKNADMSPIRFQNQNKQPSLFFQQKLQQQQQKSLFQLHRLEEQKVEESDETYEYRYEDFEEYPLHCYSDNKIAQDIQIKLQNRTEIYKVLGLKKFMWYKNKRNTKRILEMGEKIE